MTIRIGYQGIEGSNSYKAAQILALQEDYDSVEFVPLVTSAKVIDALENDKIDLGVVAVRNSGGGRVQETIDALQGKRFNTDNSVTIKVRHSICFSSQDVEPKKITHVYSHEQALKQCTGSLGNLFPNAKRTPIEDTALGASRLAEGEYDSKCSAVICSAEIGREKQLFIYQDDFQDSSDNRTEFVLLSHARAQLPLAERPVCESNSVVALKKLFNKDSLGIVTKILVVVAIMIAFFSKELLNLSSFRAALMIGGPASLIFLLLTSQKLQNYFRFGAIKGYWKYTLSPDDDKPLVAQDSELTRIVKITEGDMGLFFEGDICRDKPEQWFESMSVLLTPFGFKNNKLAYWYRNSYAVKNNSYLDGFVSLSWNSDYPNQEVAKMSGWYVGRNTGDSGTIEYERITESECYSLLGGRLEQLTRQFR